jgi:rhodanese-related sulfurtransferase
MPSTRNRTQLVVTLLILVGGFVPVAFYRQFVGRVPSVTPEQAKEMLADGNTPSVLVDVRTPTEFQENHLAAAENWPYENMAGLKSTDDVPKPFQGKRLLLICQSGVMSSFATRKLREIGMPDVLNVQGGLQTWIASGERPCSNGVCQLKLASGETRGLPFRPSSQIEQWAAVFTGFAVKPFYTTLALILAVWLWRWKSPELVALRWAMIFFFVGENFCAVNYLFCNDRSHLFEYLHSLGMVLCFGMAIYAIFEGIDRRLVKLSDAEAKCAALGLCHGCIKYSDAPCGLKRIFLLLIPAMMVLCFMPLSAELIPLSYNTEILGTFYNYSHSVVYQVFEFRYLPVVAILLLAASWAILRLKKVEPVHWAKVYFAAGAGALGFSFFRLVLNGVYRDHLAWSGIWEEVTELLFIVSVALTLWVFRKSLFAEQSP